MKKGGYVVENEGRSRKEGMAKEGVKEEACRRGIVDEGADGRVAGADAEGHLEVTALTIASLHLALSASLSLSLCRVVHLPRQSLEVCKA